MISVITACYNHGRFIGEMIDSMLVQSFQDFEIIIVNDGSTDDTAEVLGKINHDKVRIFHTENRGPAAARNLAIENARAGIIMNLDADDKIAPGLLGKAYNIMSTEPGIGIVYSDTNCFGAKKGKYDIGEYTLKNMLYDNRIPANAFFIKEDWRKVGGFSSDLIYGLEDWDFWLSIIELGRKVHHIPEKLSFYRTYSDPLQNRSGKRKTNRIKLVQSKIWIFNRHKGLYSDFPEIAQHFVEMEKKYNNENIFTRHTRNIYFKLRKILN